MDTGHSLYRENPVPVFLDSGPLWSSSSEMVEILLREIFILIWDFFTSVHSNILNNLYNLQEHLTTSGSTPVQKKAVPWGLDFVCLRFLKKILLFITVETQVWTQRLCRSFLWLWSYWILWEFSWFFWNKEFS